MFFCSLSLSCDEIPHDFISFYVKSTYQLLPKSDATKTWTLMNFIFANFIDLKNQKILVQYFLLNSEISK